jgi:uncharacterized membrane protein YeaQ/YmgE (transglycosylase-associated protein family)
MSFLLLIWMAVVGLAIGALGRLVVPGKNPMATWMTAVVGVVGGVGGASIIHLILGNGHGAVLTVVGVVFALLLVMAIVGWQRTRDTDSPS